MALNTNDKTEERVRPIEFARRLGLSRARVSQLVRRGLPIGSDGRINFEEGRTWYEGTVDHTGWDMRKAFAHQHHLPQKPVNRRTRRGLKRQRPDTEPREEEAKAYRRLIEHLSIQSMKLPEGLLTQGVRDMGLILASVDIFSVVVGTFAGKFYDLAFPDNDEEVPPDKPDYEELARRFHIKGDRRKWEVAADKIYDRMNAMFLGAAE